jgi:hypothetical protein
MKPRPFTSVLDMLSQGDKPLPAILPYDTYVSEKADFVTFAVQGRFIALPSRLLGKACLGDRATSIALDFGATMVTVSGQKLDELFEEILLRRIRVIRTGKHALCAIDTIQICEEVTL